MMREGRLRFAFGMVFGGMLGAGGAALVLAAPGDAAAIPAHQAAASKQSATPDCRLRNPDGSIRPTFTDITEVVMVVEDLDASVKLQWEQFGIGPWDIWTLDETTVSDQVVKGRAQGYAIKIAYAKIGNIHWELIQPLDTKSTYYEQLKTHGEGVHNIVFATEDYDATLAAMQGCGIGSHIGGTWFGTRFMNFASRPDLPVIAEIYDTAKGASFPPPEATYPATR
jgi:methylmalonyl-CoA/ethylmalonyl-CoA epimerase